MDALGVRQKVLLPVVRRCWKSKWAGTPRLALQRWGGCSPSPGFLSSSEKPGLQTGQSPPRPPPPGDPPRYNLDLDHGPLTQLQDQLVVNLREPPCYHGAAPPAAPSPAPGSSRAPETPPSPARQTSIRPCCLRAAEPQAAPRRDPSWPAPWARKLAEALPAAHREGERCRCTGRQSGGVDDRLHSVTDLRSSAIWCLASSENC